MNKIRDASLYVLKRDKLTGEADTVSTVLLLLLLDFVAEFNGDLCCEVNAPVRET